MIALTLAEIAAAVGGTLAGGADPAAVVTGPVTFDSRTVAPGALFAAFDGAKVDGHDFAPAALAQGAVAVLAGRDVGVPAILVDDVRAALGGLARSVLSRLPQLTVVGITGSSGKTSTKDLLGQVLGAAGPTIAPRGSMNNELGLPVTVLTADEDTRFLVLEMGARGVGHIAYLCRIAPPRIGLVLNVGSAHVGEFGGKEVTAQAKGELVESLPEHGLAVLNADDPLVAPMNNRTKAKVSYFGESPGARVRAESVSLDEDGRPTFTLVLDGAAVGKPVTLQFAGEHQVANALAAAAAALGAGMAPEQVGAALSQAVPVSGGRMAISRRADGLTIVDDAYNANPESVRAALKALATMARARPGARAWAVLGAMLELGDRADEEHDAIGRLAVRLGIDRLVAVGDGAARIHAGAGQEGSWGEESVMVADPPQALALLRAEVRPGDVVLVKASNSVGLGWVARELAQAPGAEAGAR
ncbi:MAG TPA: UDP-N-acetylmuramoyl-tripeptide--D-alanyl-D-alanine ligase [Actinocrinis sp.]|nr:UDP-N-acetylmuramoyl-tripeptide--D-alanyl-D-alanine ligase [Actinocrinis sp.]